MATTEKQKESSKKWYEKNKEKRLAQIRQYHKECKMYDREGCNKKWNEYHNRYQKERRANDPRFRLDDNLLSSLRRALKHSKNPREEVWVRKFGFTVNDLKQHLKNRIPKGYTWQDYLDGKLQLDHIIPRYLFDYTSIHDSSFKKCWAMKNLRLLPKEKNKLNYFTGFKCKAQEGIYDLTTA